MEDKNREVQIGAGLQESRINTDLIVWLQKWGPRVLYILLAVVLAYIGLDRWQSYQLDKVDEAFADYHAQRATGDPEGLLRVAEEHRGKREIWSLATLDAANVLLYSARNGLAPGADPENPTEDDVLSVEERAEVAARAAELFTDVRNHVAGEPDKIRYTLRATWGLASAAANQGDLETARERLNEVAELAREHGYFIDATLAQRRLDMLDELEQEPVVVYAEAELPESAIAPEPAPGQQGSPFGPGGQQMPPGFTSQPVPVTPPSQPSSTPGLAASHAFAASSGSFPSSRMAPMISFSIASENSRFFRNCPTFGHSST